MLKKQYQLLLIITILIASTSQILARTIDIPPSKNLPSNPQQFLKTNKPLSDPSIKRVKKEALSPPSQNNYPEKITKKTLAPHLSFSASEMEKRPTSFWTSSPRQTTCLIETACVSPTKQTICLFGEPAPTKCGIIVKPTRCPSKTQATKCSLQRGYKITPTTCPTFTVPSHCPDNPLPSACPNGTLSTNCPSITVPSHCPSGILPTTCPYEDEETIFFSTECRDSTTPTFCPNQETQATNCFEISLHTRCSNEVLATQCKDEVYPTRCPTRLQSTTCGTGEIWPTRCPEDDTPYCQPSP